MSASFFIAIKKYEIQLNIRSNLQRFTKRSHPRMDVELHVFLHSFAIAISKVQKCEANVKFLDQPEGVADKFILDYATADTKLLRIVRLRSNFLNS